MKDSAIRKKVSRRNRFNERNEIVSNEITSKEGSSFRFTFFFFLRPTTFDPSSLRLTTSFRLFLCARRRRRRRCRSSFPLQIRLDAISRDSFSGSIKTRAEWTTAFNIFSMPGWERTRFNRNEARTIPLSLLPIFFSSLPPLLSLHPRSFSIISGSQPPFLSLTSCF